MPRRSRSCFARIETLALLPVFHRLNDAKVLLVGGGDGAAWKAELMIAAGARVVLFAQDPSDMMLSLIDGHRSAFDIRTGDWAPADFVGTRLAVMDTDNDLEAATFVQAGLMTGVPVNVIDRPEFCQFQFGSIVNRSPAIISISTDGAAPILGQAIRRRVEAVLPTTLAGWAALARKLRPQINATYAMGTPRRAFWERFVDRVFSGDAPSEQHLFSPVPTGGRIIFANTGPGDPELITIKAMRALQQADVILFDDSVSPHILELGRREAHHIQTSDIAVMLRHINAHKTVVHLSTTGATPHLSTLKTHNIPVDIIPGVTCFTHAKSHRVAA